MSCEAWQEDLSAYCDGELEPSRVPAMERHLAECAECRESLAQLKQIRSLGQSLERIEAPSCLRQEVLSRISKDQAKAPGRRWFVFGLRWVVPALACCFVLFAARVYFKEQPHWLGKQPKEASLSKFEEDAMLSQEPLNEMDALGGKEPDEALRIGKEQVEPELFDKEVEPSEPPIQEAFAETDLPAHESAPALEEAPASKDVSVPGNGLASKEVFQLEEKGELREEPHSDALDEEELGLHAGAYSEPAESVRGLPVAESLASTTREKEMGRSRKAETRPSVVPKKRETTEGNVLFEEIHVVSLAKAKRQTKRLLEEWNGKLISSSRKEKGRLELVLSIPPERISQLRDSLSLNGQAKRSVAAEAGEARDIQTSVSDTVAVKRKEEMATLKILLVEKDAP